MTVSDTIERFAAAERVGDAEALDVLLAADFQGVGPLGFVLTKDQWIDRYRSGALVPKAFELRDTQVREYGDTALVLAVQRQEGSYHGHAADGEFRATIVLTRRDGSWLIAHCHLSGPLGPPPGRPPRAQ
ncbi:nuclear transport factor 2 family protein [Actinophytocola gossypii]|uniref:Nuclear transport factor 2 family protein n=1 Tax=Actinophytocola gossypii TaxID=2812003 RepID=A0ABT2JD97_9PSEU|nr:nuclear transport factor 2 family protein [Actinophytocola gossypii]MCT2585842.1 nuclear transport factor 2 family protein [Actinophytocola gossypii]